MKVLFVSRCLPLPRHHGDRLILFHLLRGLRSRGHRCELVALTASGDDAGLVAESAALADALEVDPERPRGAVSMLARLADPFPDRAERCWQPRVWRSVAGRVREGGVDLVHLFGGVQVYEHRDAARGRPRLIHPYESHSWWLTRAVAAAASPAERASLRLRRVAARAVERRIFAGFDRVVLNAEPDRRCLRSLAPGLPAVVIPNGVELVAEPVPVADRPPGGLVFVGNLAYRPNWEAARRLAREILPLVRRKVPEATLALVGADPPERVRRLAGEGVVVTGTVDDVGPWLSRARTLVSPLEWGAGMKNKILEAMAAGTPVVATPESCDGIELEHGEHALLAEGPRALAEAAVRVLSDGVLADRLAVASRRLVAARYGWPRVIDRFEALYRELTDGGAEPGAR